MHCNEAKLKLESLPDTDTIRGQGDLMNHLNECEACSDLAREKQLLQLLAEMPVSQPIPGFEQRVLQNAHRKYPSARSSVHIRWALATAASVTLAVLLTVQFYPAGIQEPSESAASAPIVSLQPYQSRMVDILLASPREMEGAQITVHLDQSLELAGYAGIRDLRWQANLKSGNNKLSLPVHLLKAETGVITITVEHDGASKQLSVLVDAQSGDNISI